MPATKVVLKHKESQRVFRGEVIIDGPTKIFRGLPAGDYERTYIPPDGWEFINKNPDTEICRDGTIALKVVSTNEEGKASISPPPPPPPPSRPPWQAIIPSAIGISLFSNFGSAEPFFREIARQLADDVPPPRSSPRPQPRNNPQPRTPQPQARYNRLFSPSVEARLRDCVQSNIVRLSGIPTLSSLLESLSWEREPSGEFERQLIFAYTRYQQVKALIEECDPTLIQEILAAQEEVAASDPQFPETAVGIGESTPNFQAQATVTVIGSFINIRVGPSTQNAILGQVTYGTVLGVDQENLALLSPSERLAISEGRGWLPIFIPDGRQGYIYSLYVTPRP